MELLEQGHQTIRAVSLFTILATTAHLGHNAALSRVITAFEAAHEVERLRLTCEMTAELRMTAYASVNSESLRNLVEWNHIPGKHPA